MAPLLAGMEAAAAPDAAGRDRAGLLPVERRPRCSRAPAEHRQRRRQPSTGHGDRGEAAPGERPATFVMRSSDAPPPPDSDHRWRGGRVLDPRPAGPAGRRIGMVLLATPCTRRCCWCYMMLAWACSTCIEQAPFLGFVQIIVYTGAIMILFLFVLMLVGRDAPTPWSRCCAGSGWSPRCSASVSPAGRGQRPAAGAATRCRRPGWTRPTQRRQRQLDRASCSSPTTCSRSS